MGFAIVEYPVLEEKLALNHPLVQLIILKSLKSQQVITESVYRQCLALLNLPDSYIALKKQMEREVRK